MIVTRRFWVGLLLGMVFSRCASPACAQPDPDLILFPGDFLAHECQAKYDRLAEKSHRADPGAYRQFTAKVVQFLANAFWRRFPNVRILPTLGNDDSYCGDYRIEPKGPFLAMFADVSQLVRERRFAYIYIAVAERKEVRPSGSGRRNGFLGFGRSSIAIQTSFLPDSPAIRTWMIFECWGRGGLPCPSSKSLPRSARFSATTSSVVRSLEEVADIGFELLERRRVQVHHVSCVVVFDAKILALGVVEVHVRERVLGREVRGGEIVVP